jgi:hypothetical protein
MDDRRAPKSSCIIRPPNNSALPEASFAVPKLDLPVRMVQSVADAVLLSVPTLELRQILPDAAIRHDEN